MNATDVECPICGTMNEKLDLDETDGWMECEKCHNVVQVLKYVKSRRIPVYQMKDCQVLVPLNELEKDVKSEKYSLLPLLHRQLLEARGLNLHFSFTVDYETALKFRKQTGQYLRQNQREDITVEVFI